MEKKQSNTGLESPALVSVGNNMSKRLEIGILALSLLSSLAGFAISLGFIGRFSTSNPVEIHCDKEDLARMDKAGELMRQILQK